MASGACPWLLSSGPSPCLRLPSRLQLHPVRAEALVLRSLSCPDRTSVLCLTPSVAAFMLQPAEASEVAGGAQEPGEPAASEAASVRQQDGAPSPFRAAAPEP